MIFIYSAVELIFYVSFSFIKQGSLMTDGDVWKINPDEQTASSGLHRAKRSTDLYLALDIYNRQKRELNPETMKAIETDGNRV